MENYYVVGKNNIQSEYISLEKIRIIQEQMEKCIYKVKYNEEFIRSCFFAKNVILLQEQILSKFTVQPFGPRHHRSF